MNEVDRVLESIPSIEYSNVSGLSKVQSKLVYSRLHYLWATAVHYTIHKEEADPLLSHHYMTQFHRLAIANSIALPKLLKDYLCRNCGGILIPNVNCTLKSVSRFSHSKVNRSRMRSRQVVKQMFSHDLKTWKHEKQQILPLRNEVISSCMFCKGKSTRNGATKNMKASKKRKLEEKPSKSGANACKMVKDAVAAASSRAQEPKSILDSIEDSKKKKKKIKSKPGSSTLQSFLSALKQ